MSHFPDATVRRGHGVSDDAPSGAMATPPIVATDAGDLSTSFETSATIRVTDTLERMMAQAVDNLGTSTVPDSCPPGR
jgi:hypothetical protein